MEAVALPTGKIRGKWIPRLLIGKGGLAEVYSVFDQETGTDAALKWIKPEFREHERTLERTKLEERTLRRLRFAPNIVRLHRNQPYSDGEIILTELIKGPTVQALLEDGLGFKRTVQIGAEVAECLAAAHACDFVHRDIKPSNILVGEDGGAVLCDWGAAFNIIDGKIYPDTVVGTPLYQPPEQLDLMEDERTDIYALGCTLYECLTGKVACPDEVLSSSIYAVFDWRMRNDGLNPCSVEPSIPKGLGELVEKTMRRDPNERIQTAAELQAGLEWFDFEDAPAPRRTRLDLDSSAATKHG